MQLRMSEFRNQGNHHPSPRFFNSPSYPTRRNQMLHLSFPCFSSADMIVAECIDKIDDISLSLLPEICPRPRAVAHQYDSSVEYSVYRATFNQTLKSRIRNAGKYYFGVLFM